MVKMKNNHKTTQGLNTGNITYITCMILTERELEVLKLKKIGFIQIKIAKKLKITQQSVSEFYNNAVKKIKLSSVISDVLTQREIEVLKLKEKGFSQVKIAKKFKISQPAVSSFYNNAMKKIGEAKEIQKIKEELKLEI